MRTTGIAAGLHLFAEFPAGYGCAVSIVERAARGGVRLYPVAHDAITGRGPAGAPEPAGPARIVPGYANLTPRRIAAGVQAVARALR